MQVYFCIYWTFSLTHSVCWYTTTFAFLCSLDNLLCSCWHWPSSKVYIICLQYGFITSFYDVTTPWPQSASELYRSSDRRLSVKLVPASSGWRGVTWLVRLIPTTVISVFLTEADPHEAEWIPFQTHCFSENLVVSGIEPGPVDL
jgi:hypothetical protein